MTKKQTAPEKTEASSQSGLSRLMNYFELSRVELRKVSWPSSKETRVTSIAVLIFVVVMAVFLGLVDLGLSKLIGLILS